MFLRAEFSVVSQHLAHRHAHFMKPALLQSQFHSLEAPTDAIAVEASRPISEIVSTICSALGIGAAEPAATKDE